MNHEAGAVQSVICPNCDSALPEGCAGLFKASDGQSCWLNRPDKIEAAKSDAAPPVKSPLPAQAGGGEETSILDSSARSFKERLWMVTNDDGSYVITDEANKGGLGGFAPPWGKPYREVLNDFMRHRDRSESSAIELYAAIHRGIHVVPGTEVRGVYIVSKGTAYKVLAGTHHQGRFLGFGGQKFRVTLKSGEVIESNNTWYIGKIAPHLRKQFPDNATMEAIP
jgi:hypothetical protein